MPPYGKEHQQARAFGQPEYRGGYFIYRVFFYLAAAFDAVSGADARVQQPQIVIDFGHRGHGGARVARAIFLADGDGGRDALDQLHVRLFNALQELPRISRERLHVTPLALGIDGVEGERRFARSRDPGDHR